MVFPEECTFLKEPSDEEEKYRAFRIIELCSLLGNVYKLSGMRMRVFEHLAASL